MTIPFISTNRLSWSALPLHGSHWDRSKGVMKWRSRILKRDDYTCQGCGWRSEEFQELHNIDGDHSNFREANLETLCPLCHQLFHPCATSISGGGFMIWLPELTQAELNRLTFPMFWALSEGQKNPLYSVSRAVYSMLDQRRVELESHVGKSDAASFGQMLLKLSPEDYAKRFETLAPFKLLASQKRFQTEIEYWGNILLKERTAEEWIEWASQLSEIVPTTNDGNIITPVDKEGA